MRTSRSEGSAGKTFTHPDNDGDIPGRVQETIDTSQHANVLGDDPEKAQIELEAQAAEEKAKQQKIRDKEIEEAIINSTQRQADAINKTIQEIMYGPLPEKKEGKN